MIPVAKNATFSIDFDYLARQTMGDKQLEREILALFAVQCANCAIFLGNQPDFTGVQEIAHQMKGCAMSVGAKEIAIIARDLENAPENVKLARQLREQCLSAKEYIDLQR